jgi:hypothetical protein
MRLPSFERYRGRSGYVHVGQLECADLMTARRVIEKRENLRAPIADLLTKRKAALIEAGHPPSPPGGEFRSTVVIHFDF